MSNDALQLKGTMTVSLQSEPGGRWIPIPQWYVDLIFMPSRRSRRRAKKALHKRLLARSRREQRERGLL